MRRAPVFEKKNALPGSERDPTIDDRNNLARPGQDRANMRRHVVRPFRGMLKIRCVFRD